MQNSDFPVEFITLESQLKAWQDVELTAWDEFWEYPEWLKLVVGKIPWKR